jgi:hypothetical protein
MMKRLPMSSVSEMLTEAERESSSGVRFGRGRGTTAQWRLLMESEVRFQEATMTAKGSDGIQGEGNYVAGRRFQDAEHKFVETAPVKEKAREAADALSGPEGAELEAARKASARGRTLAEHHAKRAETEKHLDNGLEETFPASDLVSISPGAD